MTTSPAVEAEPGIAPPADPSTTWWARLAGVVAGLVGVAVADLIAWLIAPTSSVIPAVGELIIRLLPASLVNWGKDVLGTADKPILLIMIFAGVLISCGLAGQLEWRRRYGGALIFGALAAIAVLALATATDVPMRGYVSVILGLTVGYLALRTLINQLRRWRPTTGPAISQSVESAARRRFLGLAFLLGATATVVTVA